MTRSTLSARLDALAPISAAGNATPLASLPATLRTDILKAMDTAMRQGLPVNEAAAIVVTVAADMLRGVYGASQLMTLAGIVTARAGKPFDDNPGDRVA